MSPTRKARAGLPACKERRAAGKALRNKVSRREQGGWQPAPDRPDVVDALLAANRGRLPHLLPIKYGRMAASPFGFFRGAVPVMAADLATLSRTGLTVQICGDAHVRNLGAYAAPDGHLVFDINDFDESLPGPWEWDLKRLATSLVLAGRESGNGDKDCGTAVEALVRSYRKGLRKFSEMKVLELAKYEVQRHVQRGPVCDIIAKAARATAEDTLKKYTARRNGARHFVRQPPLLTPVAPATGARVMQSLKEYRESLGADHQVILDAYRPVDVCFKVVGTGSVGVRDYVVLCFGNGLEDPMFLQVKQELASAYVAYLPELVFAHQGRRVAEGQHRMQTLSDPFLGWTTIEGAHYLVRQLRDHKASVDPKELKGQALEEFAAVAGEVLAKAHARTGDGAAISGYCGTNDRFDQAICQFALAYAQQTERDHEQLVMAIRRHKIRALRNL
ncbi:MAG: DUF2252 domain-containing protein [Terriglobales bacterium]